MKNIEIIQRKLISDSRGWLLKAINGHEAGLPDKTGEIYVVCGYSAQSRGGHYHLKASEWFTLIKGKALLRLKNIHDSTINEIELTMDNPITVFVPPFIAHEFVNLQDSEFVLLAYSDELYDPKDTVLFSL